MIKLPTITTAEPIPLRIQPVYAPPKLYSYAFTMITLHHFQMENAILQKCGKGLLVSSKRRIVILS